MKAATHFGSLMLIFFVLSMSSTLMAIQVESEWQNPEQRELYDHLVNEVRCLVCQNQTIADSNAPLAADLRREIREMVLAGKTKRTIEDFLLERYGDFVLYRPRFKAGTAVLWLAPAFLLSIGGIVMWRTLRRRAALPIGTDEDDAMDENHEKN